MLRNVIFPLFIPDDTALQEPDLTNCIRCTRSFDSNNTDININRSDDGRQGQCTSIFGTVDQHLEEFYTSEMKAGLEIYSHCTTVCNNDTNKSIDNREVTITLPVSCKNSLRWVGNKDCYRTVSFALEYFHGHMLIRTG